MEQIHPAFYLYTNYSSQGRGRIDEIYGSL